VVQAISAGHDATAAFVECLDEQALATVMCLGGYALPRAEIMERIWINHALVHTHMRRVCAGRSCRAGRQHQAARVTLT
jgi:hypothetical protein